jgi:signal transduction histidine kinase
MTSTAAPARPAQDKAAVDAACDYRHQPPLELQSNDPEVLRAALLRESLERSRAECSAGMQTEVVKLALDLLVREPDIEGFFGGLAKTMVEEGESNTCAVWLLNEDTQQCELWLAYVKDRLFTVPKTGLQHSPDTPPSKQAFMKAMAEHLAAYKPGWLATMTYTSTDERLPEEIRCFACQMEWNTTIATPLRLGTRTLGWMTLCGLNNNTADGNWDRVVLVEAIARQAALALHHSRLVEHNRLEERRKATLEERNRLARDIHDNLAQGFAAILMQLQASQREAAALPSSVARSISTAVELARTHLSQARQSVGALRPNVGNSEDVAAALQRLIDLKRRTTTVPIDLAIDTLPRFGDSVEREIVAIAHEALTNAVKHSRAAKITVRASAVQSIGLRLSVADDGCGIANEPSPSGFGMTIMQERAERIGASLTIVTAPRNGTEVVLAWHPTSLPTQVHVNA